MTRTRNQRLLVLLCSASILVLEGCRSRSESPPAATPAPGDNAATGVLAITVSGFRNQEGRVMLAVYRTADGFPSDAAKAVLTARHSLTGASATFRFEQVPYGTYAVSVLHDENGNGILDKSFFGIPQEGTGTSNNPEPGYGPPRFEAAAFAVKEPLCTIEITMRYP